MTKEGEGASNLINIIMQRNCCVHLHAVHNRVRWHCLTTCTDVQSYTMPCTCSYAQRAQRAKVPSVAHHLRMYVQKNYNYTYVP